MDPETRDVEIKKYKEQMVLNDTLECVTNSDLFKMFNQLAGMTLF